MAMDSSQLSSLTSGLNSAAESASLTSKAVNIVKRDPKELDSDFTRDLHAIKRTYEQTINQENKVTGADEVALFLDCEEVEHSIVIHKVNRLSFARVFAISDREVSAYQQHYAASPIVLDIVQKFRNIETLRAEKQNLHKIICGQILNDICEIDKIKDSVIKSERYSDMINFITEILNGSLYLTKDSLNDPQIGASLKAIKEQLSLTIDNLKSKALKDTMMHGASELKKLMLEMLTNSTVVLNTFLEYDRFKNTVIGFSELKNGIVGTKDKNFFSSQAVPVVFLPQNPGAIFIKRIAEFISSGDMDKFEDINLGQDKPNYEALQYYIHNYKKNTILEGFENALTESILLENSFKIVEHMHLLLHSYQVFSYFAEVSDHQLESLLRDPEGLKSIKDIIDKVSNKIHHISNFSRNMIDLIEEKYCSTGKKVPTKITTLSTVLTKLSNSPDRMKKQQDILSVAFKSRLNILSKLDNDREKLFKSIDNMNKTFFHITDEEGLEQAQSKALNAIKNRVLDYSKSHSYYFNIKDLQRESLYKTVYLKNIKRCKVDQLRSEIHNARANMFYNILNIVYTETLTYSDRLNKIKEIIEMDVMDMPKFFEGSAIKSLIANINSGILVIQSTAEGRRYSSRGVSDDGASVMSFSFSASANSSYGQAANAADPGVEDIVFNPRSSFRIV